MDFEKVLTHRVSTRKYNDRMPDDQTIQKVIDAALLGRSSACISCTFPS